MSKAPIEQYVSPSLKEQLEKLVATLPAPLPEGNKPKE